MMSGIPDMITRIGFGISTLGLILLLLGTMVALIGIGLEMIRHP